MFLKEFIKKKINRKRKRIPTPIRIQVWKNQFGNVFEQKCPMCNQSVINAINFEVGHDVAVSKGGCDEITNLNPICSSCNKSMGTRRWKDFKREINAYPNSNPTPNNDQVIEFLRELLISSNKWPESLVMCERQFSTWGGKQEGTKLRTFIKEISGQNTVMPSRDSMSKQLTIYESIHE